MTRKTHLVFAGILCAALTVPFILAATTSVSSGKQKVVVASKTVKVAGIPKKEDTFLTLKDLLALGMFLGTIVGAVWFLASKLGKIRTDMGSMKAELTERIITLSTEVQLLKQDVAALKEGLQQAHKSRQEIWKELRGIDNRVTKMETKCDITHRDSTGEFKAVPPPTST